MIHACEAGKGRVRREAAVARRPRGSRDGGGRPPASARGAGGNSPPVVGLRQRGGGSRTRRRHRNGHSGEVVPYPERVAEGNRRAARWRTAGRRGLGCVAWPGAAASVQQEPHVLPLPLVLRLLRRTAHELRRPLHGRHPVGARPRRAACCDRNGGQGRGRGQP
jgi:hypothetical protein